MNNITVTGNLTRDPELRKTQNDVSVCTFTVASNRPHDDGTDFFSVVVWRAQAENCSRYLSKGRKVAVTGSMRQRSYEDKQGQKRTAWELHASEVEFLSSVSRDAGSMTDMAPAAEPDVFDMPF